MYKVRVKISGETDFVTNELVFETLEKAKQFGADIFKRWSSAVEWEVRDDAGKLFYWSGENYD